jgi:hypothetical protein
VPPIMLCSIVISFSAFFNPKTSGVSIYIFCNNCISYEACESTDLHWKLLNMITS